MTAPARALAAALVLAGASMARADGFASSNLDQSPLISVAWDASRPLGTLRDFVDADSLRGAQFEVRYAVRRRFSLGLASSWLWMAQNRAAGVLTFADATVAGPAYHRVQFLTLRATADGYLATGAVQPYLGVGAGGAWHGDDQEIAALSRRSSGYSWAVDPHAGLLVSLLPGLAVHLQVRAIFTRKGVAGGAAADWISGSLGLALY